MFELPAGPDLLEVARKTLLEELLPALPPEKHYAALMVANAITIAARTARHDPSTVAVMALHARTLLGGSATFLRDADTWREFAGAIRAGRFDSGDDGQKAYELLRLYAEARCAISSPKALRGPRADAR